ncbi:MAG: hypothetical protein HY287_11135 [Planctomycetes bacterium]|nr:hypothetical protein [Planctomycetota bacterium]MBI3834872.1 hypothetical protein [Planctomycetota bacterium]
MASNFLVSKSWPNSWKSLGILLAYLVAVKLLITLCPAAFRSTSQAQVFAWPALAIWTACGAIGVALLSRTGFAGGWDTRLSLRWRLWIPIISGIAFGIAAIATDRLTHWTSFAAGKMQIPSIHISWPASVVNYPGGAIIVEIIYRLLLIPLLMWLVCNMMLGGRGRGWIFMALAVATSMIEPMGDLDLRPLGFDTMLAVFAQDFLFNFWQAFLFRRAGFVSSILTRIAFYFVWHVL